MRLRHSLPLAIACTLIAANVSAYPINDVDEDGIDNLIDNCPTVANPAQIDNNSNNIGDDCDYAQPYNIQNRRTGLCIGVKDGSLAVGANVEPVACNPFDPSQLLHHKLIPGKSGCGWSSIIAVSALALEMAAVTMR